METNNIHPDVLKRAESALQYMRRSSAEMETILVGLGITISSKVKLYAIVAPHAQLPTNSVERLQREIDSAALYSQALFYQVTRALAQII